MKTLIAALLILTTTSLFSAEEATEVVGPTVDKEVVQPTKKRYGLSSAENRENLTFQVSGAFLGREYIGENPLTVSLGYYTSPDALLMLRYSNYNSGEHNEHLSAVTLGYRLFLGNSFNITPSVYYKKSRNNDYDYTYDWNTGLTTEKYGSTYEDLGAGFRIGNEWQWTHFVMGCDWFGLNRTVKELNSYNREHSGDDDFDTEYTFTLLSFYVGYSF